MLHHATHGRASPFAEFSFNKYIIKLSCNQAILCNFNPLTVCGGIGTDQDPNPMDQVGGFTPPLDGNKGYVKQTRAAIC